MQETTTQMQEPSSGGPRRRTIGLAALAGVIGVGAIVFGLVATGAGPASVSTAPGAQAPAAVSEAGWTSPDGTTTARIADGRGGRDGVGRASISITAINGSTLSLETDNGWTRTIDATGATITKDGKTVQASALAVGDKVRLRETRNDDGTYTVTAIEVVQPSVSGTVTSISGSTVTISHRDDSTSKVVLTGSTTYTLDGTSATKAAVVTGVRIVARGTLASDGTLTATSVSVEPARSGGTVKSKDSTSITLTTRDGSTVVVKVTSSTTYAVRGVDSATLASIAVGDMVMATGTRNADGSLTATTVRAGAAGDFGGPGMGGGRGGHGMGGDRDGDDGTLPAPSSSPSGTGTNG